jgi:predicted O-linked N-acetylglucosamine transferase (SPINDLY family)
MSQFNIEQAFGRAIGHHKAGELGQAESLCRQILARRPQHVDTLHFLGLIAQQSGHFDNAVDLFRQVIALRPNFAEAHNNLGVAYKRNGQLDDAICAYREAIALKSDYGGAYSNLGNALAEMGELDEAIVAYRRAIAIKPDYAPAYSNLGNALKQTYQLDEAVAACRAAIALKPDFFEAYGNLGNALMDKGQFDEAIAAYRQAILLKPNEVKAHSDLVYSLHFHPRYEARAIAEEQLRWNRQHAQTLRHLIQPHTNDRNPDRRLRIGYVSPDFRVHPVGRFLLPLLAHHDKQQVEVFAYSDVLAADELTARMRSHVDVWRDTARISDEQAAELIRQDHIDILVDLTMHMANNRLLVFACKPAPVQVTYLAYCSSTGLETIDYRLSDPYMDPPGMDESIYSERTIRLADTYWCYEPIISNSDVTPLPALDRGFVSFGSLNNFCKVSEPVLGAWIQLLQNVPKSQLLLHVNDGSHRQRVRDRLQREGIDPARLRFAGFMPTRQYFELYRMIDLGLDTFPYAGGTTTCDALWMGVPVISLAGKTGVGRGGVSILSNIGLPDLIAGSPEMYVHLAGELAGDLARLSNLRSTLRQRMEQSPLMDGRRFAANVEAAYRGMWRTWCQTHR